MLLFLTLPKSVYAEVVINEFSPKNPEWVEFFNQSTNEINLDGYYFDDDTDFNSDSGSSSKIRLQGLFPTNSLCYLDLSSYLNDGGDSPTLFAPNGDVVDSYQYASSSANLSYSRIPDGGSWQANTVFSKPTISCQSLYVPTPVPTNSPTTAPATTSSPIPTSSPKPIPTKSPSPKPSSTSTKTDEPQETDIQNSNLSLTNVVISEPTSTGIVKGTSVTNKKPFVAIIFIFSGIIFLGYGAYLLYNKKNINDGKEAES